MIRSLRKKSTLAILAAVPFTLILIPPLWVQGGTGYSFYGIAILYSAFLLVRSIMTDRESGTIVRIYTAPITTFQYLFQNLLGYFLILLLQIIINIIVGTMRYQWETITTIKLILGYSLFAAASLAMSLAWNSLFRSRALSDGVFATVVSVMALLGGIFVPITMLPEVLKKLGMLFPTFWLSNILLEVVGEPYFYNMRISCGILLLFTCAFLIFGSKRRLE
jgi:ABC-2 type transport system permease protein